MSEDTNGRRDIQALLDIMTTLRSPDGGCPWDLEQNFKSIAPYTIEEAYEVADAIERGDMNALRDELGDLLFQAVFHAQMAAEAGLFNFGDVVAAITDKMVRRHPHVFSDGQYRTADEQMDAWESQKAAERAGKGEEGILSDVPLGLPGLARAVKLQKRAARVGFDWADAKNVLDKIAEETAELTAAIDTKNQDEVEAEFGDLLFAVANLSRHLKVDPEASLRRTNEKFIKRFRYIEKKTRAENRELHAVSLDEMEALWNEAKQREPSSA